jgi:tRNA dimethylallyltransferase
MQMTKYKATLVAIVGPTATGKTSVGIELAGLVGGEIISADSMAVYKRMDIGTAKPTLEEQVRARFHLIDVVAPDEDFSVADFYRLAEAAIEDVVSRGKMPLLVGGTGLYVRAVTEGLNIPIAAPDRELRERLREDANRLGNQALMDRLAQVDPPTAARLHTNDLNRIIRALEVYELTGMPISHFHQSAPRRPVPYESRLFGLSLNREVLYKRIEDRIDEQIACGFVEEVRGLLESGYSPTLPSMRGLGYKQIAGYIIGEYDFVTAIDLFKRDTRRFAKRQLTWFRADPRIHWIDADGKTAIELASEITSMLDLEGRD